jgi:pyruvate kinase
MDKMIQAGVDVVRVNFSHDSGQRHIERAEQVRNRARAHGRQVGVLADLQGPKIRITSFTDGAIQLNEGELFTLDATHPIDAGNQQRVGLTYKALPNDVARGDSLLLDDGAIVLWVEQVEGMEIRCKVTIGGKLSNSKGINRQGGGLSAPALTEKDRADIKLAAEMDADYVAISFPRNADDVREARQLLRDAGGYGAIVAKIERAEALDCLDEIIDAADAIMIARGDLGVEVGDAELPALQKDMIRRARSANKVVITATQMMQSMIDSPLPTRAEVFDVANAVLDGTDAVMLSAETSIGRHPDRVIEAMHRVCYGAEKHRTTRVSDHRMDLQFEVIDEAIAMSAMYAANHLGVKAIIALTESGSTPLLMSRISSGISIYGLTPNVKTRRRMTLFRGVYPVSFTTNTTDHATLNAEAVDELKRRGAIRDGDLVIITKGDLVGVGGGTNAMKVVEIGKLVHDSDLDS